jgi:hypothetical protein
MADYKISSVTDILRAMRFPHAKGEPFFPPVRYCYGGDVPRNGLFDYSDRGSPALLRGLSTVDEMHYTVNPGDRPTDWHTQCAAFVDSRIRLHIFAPVLTGTLLFPRLRNYEFIVLPSARSNFLLNEVFFCPTDESCNPSLDIEPIRQCMNTPGCDLNKALQNAYNDSALNLATPPIKLRAERAFCSFLGDIWYRDSEGPGTSASTPFVNMLGNAPLAQRALVALVNATCAVNASCNAQVNQINQAFSSWIDPCVKILADSGLYDPAQKMDPAAIPEELQ